MDKINQIKALLAEIKTEYAEKFEKENLDKMFCVAKISKDIENIEKRVDELSKYVKE